MLTTHGPRPKQLMLIQNPARYPVGAQVMTPYGPGRIEEQRTPGHWSFDRMIFFDDGTQPTEPVYRVRTAIHTVQSWVLESELTTIAEERT